jgi:hypothetical protein
MVATKITIPNAKINIPAEYKGESLKAKAKPTTIAINAEINPPSNALPIPELLDMVSPPPSSTSIFKGKNFEVCYFGTFIELINSLNFFGLSIHNIIRVATAPRAIPNRPKKIFRVFASITDHLPSIFKSRNATLEVSDVKSP